MPAGPGAHRRARLDPLIELLQEKNADDQAMAKQLKFDEVTPGVVPHKAAILLGDLRAKKAVPALVARLQPEGQGRRAPLGAHRARLHRDARRPSTPSSRVLKDAKADPAERALGRRRALSVGRPPRRPDAAGDREVGLRDASGGQKASDLRASAAIALARIAGKETFEPFKALVDKESEAQGVFGMALDRMLVANECGRKTSPATARSSTTRRGRAPRRPLSPSASRATPRRASRCCSPR